MGQLKRKRRPPLRHQSGIDDLSLYQLGVGPAAQFLIFAISLFPIVGLVIGTYYASQDSFQLRSYGRILVAYSLILHFLYFCVICPFFLYQTIG